MKTTKQQLDKQVRIIVAYHQLLLAWGVSLTLDEAFARYVKSGMARILESCKL